MTVFTWGRGEPPTGFVGSWPRHRCWRAAVICGVALGLLASPSAAQKRRRRHPVPQLYRPAGSDHRKHIVQRLPLPVGTEIKVGRYFGQAGLPKGARVNARQADFYLRSAQLLLSVRARDGALLSLARAPTFFELLRGGAPAVCDRRGRHLAFLTSVRMVPGTPPELETRGRVAGGPELELTTRYRLLGAPGQAPDALEIDSTLAHRDTRTRVGVRICDVFSAGEEGATPRGLRPFVLGRQGVHQWIVQSKGELWVERRADRRSLLVHYPRQDLAPGGSLRTRRLLLLGAKTSRATLAARAGSWAGQRWISTALKVAAQRPSTTRIVLRRAGRRYLSTALGPRIVWPQERGVRWSVALEVAGVGVGPAVELRRRKEPIVLALPPLTPLALRIRDARNQPLAAQVDALPRNETARPRHVDSLGQTTLWLAPGSYRLRVRRPDGRHRSVMRELKLVAGRARKLSVTLPAAAPARDWPAHDWIALDTHLVAPTAAAWRAAAAAGIDAAISTALGTLGSRPPPEVNVLAIRGQLLAPRRLRHGRFVAFPLKAPLDDRADTPAELFARARQGGARFINVVAPWVRGGYFAQLGVTAHGRAAGAGYSERFELFEVLTSGATAAQEERALQSFLALVGRDRRVLASAGSGRRNSADAGDWPRLLVRRPALRGKQGKPNDRARLWDGAVLLAALRAGRSVASRGPQVAIVAGKGRLEVRLQAVVGADPARQPALLEVYRGRTLVRRVPIPPPPTGLARARHAFSGLGKGAGQLVVVVRGRRASGARAGRLLAIVNPALPGGPANEKGPRAR